MNAAKKITPTPAPQFTDDQLRAIHHTLFRAAWQQSYLYEERRAVIHLLDAYFGKDTKHLTHP